VSATPRQYRAFVCAPDDAFSERVCGELRAESLHVEFSSDPRDIRRFATRGVDVVLVSDLWNRPRALRIATAMRDELGEGPALVLLTSELPLPEDVNGPYQLAIRYPVAPRVLSSRIENSLRSHRQRQRGVNVEHMADLEVRCVRAADQNFYGLLGVAHDASIDQIKRAYDGLSLKLHPDRLQALPSNELKARVADLYVSMTEAYRTLRSLSARSRYDHALATGKSVHGRATREQSAIELWEVSELPSARKYLRLAQQAITSGDKAMALVHLRFASTLDPGNRSIANKIIQLDPTGAT
jgi:DnaJ-domain-containing protein 1